MSVNDTYVIENTIIKPIDDGPMVMMECPLPGGGVHQARAADAETARKNLIPFADGVRATITANETAKQEEAVAKKQRRKSGLDTELPTASSTDSPADRPASGPTASGSNAKQLVLDHWENLKSRRQEVKEHITRFQAELKEINEEMDELGPVIKAWKGTKGE